MARILKTNLAESTLAAGINSSVLSFTLATGEGALFPNPGAGELFHEGDALFQPLG